MSKCKKSHICRTCLNKAPYLRMKRSIVVMEICEVHINLISSENVKMQSYTTQANKEVLDLRQSSPKDLRALLVVAAVMDRSTIL